MRVLAVWRAELVLVLTLASRLAGIQQRTGATTQAQVPLRCCRHGNPSVAPVAPFTILPGTREPARRNGSGSTTASALGQAPLRTQSAHVCRLATGVTMSSAEYYQDRASQHTASAARAARDNAEAINIAHGLSEKDAVKVKL